MITRSNQPHCAPRRRRWLWLWVAAAVAAAATGAPAQDGGRSEGERPESARLTPDQQRDLNLLLGLVGDTKQDLARRRDAAASLLAKGWPGAVEALAEELTVNTNATTRRAIAGAVVIADDPPVAMVKPLLTLVGTDNAALRRDAAAALGRYENGGVVERLVEMINDPPAELAAAQRTALAMGAIEALAEHRVVGSVDELIALTHPSRPAEVRDKAFASLEHLTGIDDFGADRQAWVDWWAENRNLPRDRWLARLIRTLGERNKQEGRRAAALEARFVDTLGQLYVARPEEQRPAMLAGMLGDELTAVRLLALRLVERKLLNAQPIADPVRAALRGALVDGDARVRAAAAGILRDLDDDAAQAIALERLLPEPEAAVQAAYLTLLSRKVSAEAVAPALVLAARHTTRGPAAVLLSAAAEAKLLTDEQSATARQLMRDHVAGDPPLNPDAVRLLGRLAEPGDAETIRALLTHDDQAVRSAALDCYALPTLPLTPALELLGDPIMGQRAASVVGLRGTGIETAMALMGSVPDGDASRIAPWHAAVISVAGRLNLSDLKLLDDAMAKADEGWSVTRVAVLKRVPEMPDGDAVRVELSLRLARLHLSAGRYDQADAVYRRIDADSLTQAQAAAMALGRFEAMIATGKNDEAIKAAEQLVADDPTAGAVVGRLMLDAAEKNLQAKQTEQAAALLAHTQRLAGEALTETDRARLNRLRGRLPNAPDSSS